MASAGNQAEAAAECAVAKPGFEASKAKAGNGRPISLASVATPSRGGRSREGGAGAHNGGADKGSRGPTSALEDLMRRKGVDEAWNALEEMQRQKTTTDKYTVSRMLMKTVGDGRGRLNPSRVYRGIALVEKFIDLQPKDVDEVLFNALLDTCCRLKDLSRLESIVNRMRELNVQPSPVTLGILVKTYGQAGDMQKVLQVWGDMEKQRGQANAVTYGCMIDACVKCNNLAKAVEIFKGMRAEGKHKNTILYTTLIKGYGLEKDLTRAMELFREMPKEGVPYNTITYNSILDACVKCSDLAGAEGLLREMLDTENSHEPDLITFSTLLKGYCHVGDLDKALQTAETIKARGLRCDELVYNTLMDGCVKANDITAGVGLFEEMIHSGMRPSAITHSILARLYQRAGYDDAPAAVAQLYQHHGIERPSGGDRKGSRARSPRGARHGDDGHSSLPSPFGSPRSSVSVASSLARDSGSEAGFASWGVLPAMPSYFECQSAEPSAPSTPCGSPLHSPMQQFAGLQLQLPAEALQASMVPPLPGSGGPEQSQAALPFGAFGGQGGMVLQQAPAWPFCPGSAPATPAGAEAGLQQGPGMFSMPVMQGPGGASPVPGTPVGFDVMAAACAPGGDASGMQCMSPVGAPMQPQQGPFFMPMPVQQPVQVQGWAVPAPQQMPMQQMAQMPGSYLQATPGMPPC